MALAAYAAVASFPGPDYPGPGLDAAWRIQVNRLGAERGFGRDVAFTYGPLGGWLVPTDVRCSVVGAAVLRFAQQIALAAFVAWLVLRRRAAAAVAVVAAFVFCVWSGALFEHRLVLWLPLLALGAAWRRSGACLVVAWILAAVALFLKTSLGIAALGVCVAASAIVLARRRRWAWRAVLASALAYAATLLAGGAILLRSPRDVGEWLRLCGEIADGYSAAMSLDGAPWHVAAGAAAFGACALATLWLLVRRSPAGDVALALAVPAFVAFKHAYVRHDVMHDMAFLPWAITALVLVLVYARDGVERALSRGALAVALAGYVSVGIGSPVDHPPVSALLTARLGWTHVRAWADVGGEVRRHHEAVRRVMAPDVLPSAGERLRDGTVGVIPWELSYCPANALSCVTNPTLQLYSAYTARLDRRTAALYDGPRAPRYVLVDEQAIDQRQLVLDTPATIRVLLQRYQLLGSVTDRGTLLLERRSVPHAQPDPPVLSRTRIVPGAWIPVPLTRGLPLAFAEFRLTRRGTLENLLYKIRPVFVDVRYGDGRTVTSRIVPDTARNGLPVAPRDVQGSTLTPLLRSVRAAYPTEIRFWGPGLQSFRQPVPLTWAEMQVEAIGEPDRVLVPSSGG